MDKEGFCRYEALKILKNLWQKGRRQMFRDNLEKPWFGGNMKRIISILACISMMLGLCACGGNVKNVETHEVTSEIYSQEDISSAIEIIKDEFDRDWKGCTLTEIYYAGDEASEARRDVAKRHDADEVIVLLSSFDVDASGGDGSLNPNSTYDNWNWILVRTDGGTWQHVDHGY